MKRLILVSIGLAMVVAAPLFAAVPSTMSYQGVLTDNAGNLLPDAPHNFVFKIYTVPVAGAAIWTETQNGVPLSKGGFNVILGSVTPLNLAFDVQYYLGINVDNTGEMSPRVVLGSAPYSLALRLPFAGSASSSGPVLSISNGGTGAAIQALSVLDIGTGALPGTLRIFGGGSVVPILTAGDDSRGGTDIEMFDEAGGRIGFFEPDASGTGGFFNVSGGTGSFVVDGNGGAGNSPRVSITGASSNMSFNTNATGDAAVSLPTDAISAGEILDEPGIAQAHAASVTITSTSSAASTDILALSITIPSAGYIVLSGDFQAGMFGTSRIIGIMITDVSGAASDGSHYFFAGNGSTAPGYLPVSIHRTYFEGAAGTYTFYLQGWNDTGTGAYAWDPTFTADYFPTGYGSVTTVVSASDASKYSGAQPARMSGSVMQPSATGAMEVDLRQLELQAARTRAAAQDAQQRLLEAELARQSAVRPTSVKK